MEKQFSSLEDRRSPASIEIVKKAWGPNPIVWTTKLGSGTVRSASGFRGGRFSPGDLKLRNFTASTKTYHYAESTISADYVDPRMQDRYGPIVWSGQLGARAGILTAETVRRLPSLDVSWNRALAYASRNRAFAKFNDSDHEVGEFIAELPETFKMLYNWTAAYRRVIKSARKGGFTWSRANRAWQLLRSGKPLKRLPGQLSSAWLTWRYGIRPLFWDALMIVEMANEKIKRSKAYGLRRQSAGIRTSDGGYFTLERLSLQTDATFDAALTWSEKVKCKTVVYYSLLAEQPVMDWILQKYGMNPRQVPALLWELTPLSFVVDWFVDIGRWVQAIVPNPNVRVLGWSTSQVREVTLSRAATRVNPGPQFKPAQGLPGTDRYTLRYILREVGNSNPGLVPWINPEIKLSLQRWADLLTLALQRCRPKP